MRTMPCPNGCGGTATDRHLRDTGDTVTDDGCPVLAERRHATIRVAIERRAPGLLTVPDGYTSGIDHGHGHKR